MFIIGLSTKKFAIRNKQIVDISIVISHFNISIFLLTWLKLQPITLVFLLFHFAAGHFLQGSLTLHTVINFPLFAKSYQ